MKGKRLIRPSKLACDIEEYSFQNPNVSFRTICLCGVSGGLPRYSPSNGHLFDLSSKSALVKPSTRILSSNLLRASVKYSFQVESCEYLASSASIDSRIL